MKKKSKEPENPQFNHHVFVSGKKKTELIAFLKERNMPHSVKEDRYYKQDIVYLNLTGEQKNSLKIFSQLKLSLMKN